MSLPVVVVESSLFDDIALNTILASVDCSRAIAIVHPFGQMVTWWCFREWITFWEILAQLWANSAVCIPFIAALNPTKCGGGVKHSLRLISFLHLIWYIHWTPHLNQMYIRVKKVCTEAKDSLVITGIFITYWFIMCCGNHHNQSYTNVIGVFQVIRTIAPLSSS